MSFLRHRRSIVRWGFPPETDSYWLRLRLLTVSMSRSRLFLGGSLSTGARFRFIGSGQNAV